MGDSGVISPRWAKVHKRQSPRISTYAVTVSAGILSVIGGIELLAEATNALIYVMFLLVNVIVVLLRFRQPDTARPFRVKLAIRNIPVIPCLGIAATLAMSLQLELQPVLVAFALLGFGLLLYAVDTSRR
jgi:APA family basic amino acid/polyamine antiporter